MSRKEQNSLGSCAAEVGHPFAGGGVPCANLDPVLSHRASHFQALRLGLLSLQTSVPHAVSSPILQSWRPEQRSAFPLLGAGRWLSHLELMGLSPAQGLDLFCQEVRMRNEVVNILRAL